MVLSQSEQQSNVYRPVHKLIPFELRGSCKDEQSSNKVKTVEKHTEKGRHIATQTEGTSSRRPVR